MKFEHPLARSAKVWKAHEKDGAFRDVLVVVTTLELDSEHKKYKPDLVGKLRAEALTFLEQHPGKAGSVLLMNKPKS